MKEETRAERKMATRGRILDAAKEMLEEKGYKASSIRAIATGASVAPGTVLMHFQDKQDMLHAALFDDLQVVWSGAKAREDNSSLEEFITEIVADLYRYYALRPKLTRELLRESMFADDPWKERFGSQVFDVLTHMATKVAKEQSAGRVKSEANPQIVASSCLSFYYFALIGWVQGAFPDPLPFFQQMLRPYLQSLQEEIA